MSCTLIGQRRPISFSTREYEGVLSINFLSEGRPMSKQRNAGNRNRVGNNGQSNMLEVKIETNTSAKVDPKSISGWTTHSDPAAGVHSIRSTKLGDSIVLNNN